jgi:hypothetical protein
MEVAARAANPVSEQDRLPVVLLGGTQRGSRFAAGALAVFAVDPSATTYRRAAGALQAFTDDLQSIIYK